MEILTEEQELLKRLAEIKNKGKLDEAAEKKAELDAAFERCLTSEYVINVGDYPHYITLRKISDLEKSEDLGGCIKVHEHEEVRIMHRVRDENSRFNGSKNGIDVSASYEKSLDMSHKSGFIQKGDFPITEEEFVKAKNFAIASAKLLEDFINNNPYLTKL